MRRTAYKMSREMVWSNVAQHINSFDGRDRNSVRLVPSFTHRHWIEAGQSPQCKSRSSARMTDSAGILQHATFTIPHFQHGYCTDDNARALILMMLLDELNEDLPQYYQITGAYCLHSEAFNPIKKRFRNFMSFNRQWLEEFGSEDSHPGAGRSAPALEDPVTTVFSSSSFAAFSRRRRSCRDLRLPSSLGLHHSGPRRVSSCTQRRPVGRRLRESLGARLLECFHNVADRVALVRRPRHIR